MYQHHIYLHLKGSIRTQKGMSTITQWVIAFIKIHGLIDLLSDYIVICTSRRIGGHTDPCLHRHVDRVITNRCNIS